MTSCVTAAFTPSDGVTRLPKRRDQVEVIREGVPAWPYKEVGSVRVRSALGYRLGMDKLIAEAAAAGCDAIDRLSAAADFQSATIGDSGEKTREDDFSATCIVYLVATDAGFQEPVVPAPSPPTESPPFRPGSPE